MTLEDSIKICIKIPKDISIHCSLQVFLRREWEPAVPQMSLDVDALESSGHRNAVLPPVLGSPSQWRQRHNPGCIIKQTWFSQEVGTAPSHTPDTWEIFPWSLEHHLYGRIALKRQVCYDGQISWTSTYTTGPGKCLCYSYKNRKKISHIT